MQSKPSGQLAGSSQASVQRIPSGPAAQVPTMQPPTMHFAPSPPSVNGAGSQMPASPHTSSALQSASTSQNAQSGSAGASPTPQP